MVPRHPYGSQARTGRPTAGTAAWPFSWDTTAPEVLGVAAYALDPEAMDRLLEVSLLTLSA